MVARRNWFSNFPFGRRNADQSEPSGEETYVDDAPPPHARAQPDADDADDAWNDRNRPWSAVAQPADEEANEGENSLWRKRLAEQLLDPTTEFAYDKTFALKCGGGVSFTENGPTRLIGEAAMDIGAVEMAVLRHAKRSGGISVRDSAGSHTDFVMMAAAIAEWHDKHDNVHSGKVKHRYKPNKQNRARYEMMQQRVNAYLNDKYAGTVADLASDHTGHDVQAQNRITPTQRQLPERNYPALPPAEPMTRDRMGPHLRQMVRECGPEVAQAIYAAMLEKIYNTSASSEPNSPAIDVTATTVSPTSRLPKTLRLSKRRLKNPGGPGL